MLTTYRLALLALAFALLGCDSNPAVPRIEETTFAPELGIDLRAMTQTGTGLYVQDLQVGSGAEAVIGRRAFVYYRGWLADGTLFDHKLEPDEPAQFTLAPGSVIAGFAEGVRGMRIGGSRRFIIPPRLGYGANPPEGLPANAILVFEVRLVGVE